MGRFFSTITVQSKAICGLGREGFELFFFFFFLKILTEEEFRSQTKVNTGELLIESQLSNKRSPCVLCPIDKKREQQKPYKSL